MKRVFSYVKKRYKIFIPFILLLILFIGFFTYKQINNYTTSKKDSFYMYLIGVRKDYDATLTFNKDKEVTQMEIEGETIEIDSTPIYYKNKTEVLFPTKMSMVFPLKSNAQYKVNSFATISEKNEAYYLNTNNFTNNYSNFFLYDGENLFFFINEVTLKINDLEVKLSPMSYVIYNPNGGVEYYNYEKDEYDIKEIIDANVVVYNDHFKVNVMNDSVYAKDNERLLIKDIDALTNIKE